MSGFDRRTFLTVLAAAGAGAGIGVPLLSGIAGSSSTGTVLRSQLALPEPFTVPFTVPPVLAPTGDRYEIVQRAATAEILPGVPTPIWGYNGIFPGPTIVSRSGDPAVVHHRNALPVPVVAHLHGGHTPASSDGYPTDLIVPAGAMPTMPTMPGMPGMPTLADPRATVTVGERTYTYPLRQRAATLWYHDHRMGFTGASVWRGLAGFHLVHDDEEDALPLPRGDRDLPLMIADRAFAADGSLRYPSVDPTLQRTPGVSTAYSGGVLGDVILVNGRPWPLAPVPAVRHRLRILNASNARRYSLALDPPPPGGGGLVQIGSDGGLLDRPRVHDAIEVAPAERFDVVADFGRYPVGSKVTLVNRFGSGSTAVVMRFHVTRRERDDTRVPATLSTIEQLDPTHAVATRTLLFQDHGGAMGWQINGHPFSPGYATATPRLGSIEVWRLISDFHHPIHLHLVHFQVLGRGLSGPGAYDAGWKDTLDLRPAEEAAIVARFDDYAGRFVFHCHNLEHEDMAMMANFQTA
ncbi:MAG TPA: multicopper oxidase family protein [Pseudonocardiaceae bacterium]|nr:multicopper oxidase family protein [Pseudonocardiaceae bacterium]